MRAAKHTVAALLAIGMAGCASVPPEQREPYDPWESLNRPIWTFNYTFDRYLLRPIAKGYDTVAPKPVKAGVFNFFENLRTVGYIPNHVLQGKFVDAGRQTGRQDGKRLALLLVRAGSIHSVSAVNGYADHARVGTEGFARAHLALELRHAPVVADSRHLEPADAAVVPETLVEVDAVHSRVARHVVVRGRVAEVGRVGSGADSRRHCRRVDADEVLPAPFDQVNRSNGSVEFYKGTNQQCLRGQGFIWTALSLS